MLPMQRVGAMRLKGVMLIGVLFAASSQMAFADSFYFRAKPQVVSSTPSAPSIVLLPPTQFNLTKGVSVSLPANMTNDGSSLVVGAYGDAEKGTNAGAAYFIRMN